MKYEKGDLIAVKTLENNRVTCIVISTFNNGQFSYCYTLETGRCRLIYVKEVEFIIAKNFSTDLDLIPDDMDYSFYEACANAYSYTPYFGFPYDFGEDDE